MPGALVKTEPSRRHAATPDSPCKGRAETVVSGTIRPSPRNRQVRSAAPSVSTFRAAASHVSPSEVDVEDDDVVMYLETRARQPIIKPEYMPQPPSVLESVSVANDSVLNRNFGRIANNLKALHETLGELQNLAISHVITTLPSLVLVGDQSSGKSTLMSGIAGVSLPQKDGMCTRSPFHIRLNKNPTWQVEISLQQDYRYDESTKSRELGPWVKQTPESKPFWSSSVKNDDQIRVALAWAQVALLSHDLDHRRFIPRWESEQDFDLEAEESRLASYENNTLAKFSPNTVALHIRGPNTPDLSFFDLPGLIKTPKHEGEEYLVKMAENLASKYISDNNAIIMWAVPMNADPETSSTLSIIRKRKAQDRTVGVMTKADLLPSGRNYQQWLQMLQGTQHKVGHGYFITARQPMEHMGPDLDLEQQSSLERQNSFEESYFHRIGSASEAGVWPQAFNRFSTRCGLDALVVFLSETLSGAFHQSLPGILGVIESRLGEVDDELRRLPGTPSNPFAELRTASMQFMESVKQSLKVDGSFDQLWGEQIAGFERKIIGLKPRYIVNQDLPTATPATASPPFSVSTPFGPRPVIDLAKSSDDASVAAETPSRRRNHGDFLDGQQDVYITPKRQRVSEIKEEDSRAGSVTPTTPFGRRPRNRSLEQVRAHIRSRTKHGVPDEIPVEIKVELSLEAIALWDWPLDLFISSFIALLQQRLLDLLAGAFERLRNKAAFRQAQEHLQAFVNHQEAKLKKMLSELYMREKGRLYTRDITTFERWKKSEKEVLVHSRHYYVWKAHTAHQRNPKEKGPLKPWGQMTAEERREEEKERQILGPDAYEKELDVCAYVRGYYQTAAHRFIDSVGLAVGSDLIPAIVAELSGASYLEAKLGLLQATDDTHMAALMAEEPEVATRRKKLQDEKEKLAKAIGSIDKLRPGAENDSAIDIGSSQPTNPATSFASVNGAGGPQDWRSRVPRPATVDEEDNESAVV